MEPKDLLLDAICAALGVPENLPEGHGRSFRLGVADELATDQRTSERSESVHPPTHDASYRQGREVGKLLVAAIAVRTKETAAHKARTAP